MSDLMSNISMISCIGIQPSVCMALSKKAMPLPTCFVEDPWPGLWLTRFTTCHCGRWHAVSMPSFAA